MKLRALLPIVAALTAAAAEAATFDVPAGNITALKSALAGANSNGEDDVINLAPGSTYTLSAVDNSSNGATGLPRLMADGGRTLTVNGNGATITRSTSNLTPDFRILYIAPNATVTLRGLTLDNGRLSGFGAGIYNDAASLTLIDCTLSRHEASSLNAPSPTFGLFLGGAIYNNRGTIAMRGSTLRENAAIGTYSSTAGLAQGGALCNAEGTVSIVACTFSKNRAYTGAGAAPGANNTGGGAIVNRGTRERIARTTIASSTFEGNSALMIHRDGVSTIGTAIYHTDGSDTGVVEIANSIIAGEQDPMLSGAAGTIKSHGYNLTNGDGGGFLSGVADQRNTDPQLRPLASNGGPTQTYALAITSPALDRGKHDALPGLAAITDQRGAARPVDYVGFDAAPGGDGSDIGAFEKGPPDYTVTTTSDHNDGTCSAADCTLREAINAANAQPAADTIGFAPAVVGTINLNSVLPDLSTNIEIAGPGANLLNVRRNSGTAFRIFRIDNGTTSGPEVSIVGLTLSNGQGTETGTPGGGIYNDFGVLRLLRCVLSGNGGRNGAGLMNFRGTVTIADSTMSGNISPGFGGAVFNQAADGPATLTIVNSTLHANLADRGAAIYNAGNGAAKVVLLNSTISDNSVEPGGVLFGGIYSDGASTNVTLRNTILKAGASGANFVAVNGATVTSQGNNISSDAAGGDTNSTGPGGFLNQPGDKRNVDPKLDSSGIQNNGGPTATHALQSTSPAIDAGNHTAAPAFDQRGFVRVGIADVGAFEFAGAAPTPPPTPTPTPTPTATPTPVPNRFANISTRLRVETGDNVLIGGFIVTGSMQKRIIVRALGPSLPVGDKLANPIVELYDGNAQLIAANDNWQEAPNAQEILASTIPPPNELEAAILRNVDLGAYTAVVRDAADGEGVGLVEVYDLGDAQDSRLANISTRGRVQTADNVMIGGLIVTGSSPQKVIVRAIGPSLGIAGQLEDPFLELYDGNGNLIRSNNNWKDSQQPEIEATTIPPSNDLESAIVTFLSPAAYTAVVSGVNGGTGVGLVEAYALQ
jgi:CSLREA domain-containing protein